MEDKFKRRPNELSLSRVKTIMKSSPDVENVSQESVFLVTKATELFIKYMVEEAYKESNNAKALEYNHVSELVQTREELCFLREIVPRKCKLGDIEEIIKQKDSKAPLSPDLSLISDDEILSYSQQFKEPKSESSLTTRQKDSSSIAIESSPKPGSSSTKQGPASRTRHTSSKSGQMSSETFETVTRSAVTSPPGTPSTITLSSSSRDIGYEGSPSPTFSIEAGPSKAGLASPMSAVTVSSGSRTPSPSPSYSSLSPEALSAVPAPTVISVDIVDSLSDDSLSDSMQN
ncbi:uncharacterized protein [Periplaneta americana]|uniref:uncharacterized protein n=1 Tax=Periplaneta americana TaxID=6978 RepID=UPI0037E7941D